ncbi:MAG: valine--tRNA ligase [Candidatus Hydrogenedentes bacterium]|nr:valine--tRNA ligase [Candidatus Hydrogenedentota bacterium]
MELPKKYQPEESETRWLNAWAEQGVYRWDPARSREETFVVDTPPPTVSGSLHVGHLFSYSHQDFIVRFQRMMGKNIFFPIGWDDNGLPTERRVQNLLNVKCEAHLPYDPDFKAARGKKGDPTPISRKNFVELCDEVIVDDEKAFKQLWTRLGMSYDWEQEYATINEHSRRISQLSFLDLLEKGEIYQDEKPVMWDVDFQTAIAQAELEDKERPSAYNFLRFGVEGSEAKLVIATTRPELLPACVAVLVHPDDARYREFVGKNAITPLFEVPVPIMADPKADPEKGTGVVMVCTFGDQTDVEWWQAYKLPLRQIIGRDGHLLPVLFVKAGEETSEKATHLEKLEDGREVVVSMGAARTVPSLNPDAANSVYGQMKGKYTKQAQKIILEIAEGREGVIDRPAEAITHAVKFFEKGDRPLELVPTRQWYTRIMDKKDALVAQGQKIQWHPEYMVKRYTHWVEGLNQDWCLSRQRFFGVPIPVWYRIDEHGEVRYEQRILPPAGALPIDPLSDVPAGFAAEQRDQPGGFTGEPDVLDTWATSSLSPQIASKWVLDGERHAKLFPMDMRPQAHDIIRTWAFYTIVKAYLHEGEVPWRNVVLSGWILDPDRKKMSKSQGNVVTPEPLIDEFGADAVRYWAARARLGVDTAYDEQVFKVGKKLVTKVFNASKFAIGRFADVPAAEMTPDKITTELDRAVIAELRPVIEKATRAFQQFDYAQALSLVEDYFWRVFCDNYLELAKQRTYDEGLTPGRLSACTTLRLVHRALIRLLAPFTPYITEEVWSWAYAGDAGMANTVHRSPWPSLAEFEGVPAPAHADTYNVTIAAADAVRKAKADANVSMAAPVRHVAFTVVEKAQPGLEATLEDIQRMLKIEAATVRVGAVENALASAETRMAPPAEA